MKSAWYREKNTTKLVHVRWNWLFSLPKPQIVYVFTLNSFSSCKVKKVRDELSNQLETRCYCWTVMKKIILIRRSWNIESTLEVWKNLALETVLRGIFHETLHRNQSNHNLEEEEDSNKLSYIFYYSQMQARSLFIYSVLCF